MKEIVFSILAATDSSRRVKICFFVLLPLACIHDVFGQGVIFFANGRATAVLNFCTGEPVIPGSTFLAGLYFAPDGTTDESQFAQVGVAASFPFAGVFIGGSRTAPTTIRGGYGMFQVKAWESAFGETYEEASLAPPQNGRFALLGKSNIFRSDTADPNHPTEPPFSIVGGGFRGFYVGNPETCIPEPKVMVLQLSFIAAFLFWKLRTRPGERV